jgi:Flp pilus assembly protein TadG
MRRRRSGQSLVEFALVVPLFLLLVFALIFTYVSLSNGTREMARVAAVSTGWSSSNATDAFNNQVVFAGTRNSTTDSVTVLSGNAACARARDTGGTCTTAPASVTCPLTSTPTANPPLSACTLNQPNSSGFVEVQVSYTFQFNPLFQNRLSGITDVSFMNPTALVTTTARAYVE